MDKTIGIKLGRKIKRLRKLRGYTQERLSELTGIDYKYLQRIEGRNPPSLKVVTVGRLAKAFNISISELLNFKGF